ncbi:MAG: porU [Flaviaesturariibacter sp.]|nr:porU [Flaviaesturariibacter sp.]
MTALCKGAVFAAVCCLCAVGSGAQRTYKPHSVLASGAWYKIGVSEEGIQKMDAAFLTGLGLGSSIPSGQLRIFGGESGMLPESNAAGRTDDLEELAILVVDGGDGIINGSDYVLFYTPGPNPWRKDSANARFSHSKNLFSDQAFYFLSVGGTGRRVSTAPPTGPGAVTVTTFDERLYHELDSVNFLSSGKEWYGEELSNLPGHGTTRQFSLPASGVVPGAPFVLSTDLAARSIGSASRFTIQLNGQVLQQAFVPPVSSGLNDLFAQSARTVSSLPAPASPSLTFTFTPGGFNAQGWINWFEVFYRRQLAVNGGQLLFRDWASVGNPAATFRISGADATTQVWDVTNPLSPARMPASLAGGELSFSNAAQSLHEYVAFGTGGFTPKPYGRIGNQDLHNSAEADLLVITHATFLQQALRLAQFHQQRHGMRTIVVTTEQVFNEFAAGRPDPTALRDFTKMYYDRYRASWASGGKYLLLFGRASFDYKDRVNNNTNFVPAYESTYSLDPLATYTSDDFFGFLDDNEDINSNLLINTLDIGIGRAPVANAAEAKNFVDKIFDYHSPASFGPWRNNTNFIADDEDFNLHLQDAETLTQTTASVAPDLNITKIYLDAFRQEGGTAGGRYPQANAAVNNNIYNGTLIWNYSGHGGPPRLAEEVIIDQSIVNTWANRYRLPLFITATCDFAAYDLPNVASLGENLLVRPLTGAIALMTTTRVVFAFSNRILNNNYLRIALEPDPAGRYKSLGEAVQAAKNFTYLNGGDIINNRKFALLGDPAMTLGYPQMNVNPLTVNGRPLAGAADTLSATEEALITGEVTSPAGVRLANFNGTVYLSLYDKPQTIRTLANDPTSIAVPFQSQTSSLFRGKVSAVNGLFSFRFKLPRDLNFQYGSGKLSFYANDSTRDANGYSTNIIIGGIAPGAITDKEGPTIRAYLNDEKFANGGLVNQTPVLLLRLADSSGFNTGNAGIDHDIVVTVDDDNRNFYILNDFYESELNSYQKGAVRFQLPAFAPGRHTLRIKAWDVMNNSSETTIEFTVAANEALVLDHVLNYPNPFTTKTSFWFEHNRPGMDLQVKVEIFTITGRIIKTITRTINTEGNRSSDTDWDGTDAFGDKVGRGVYLYRLSVQSADGKKASHLQRLVSIR